jgi:hypothetical protein
VKGLGLSGLVRSGVVEAIKGALQGLPQVSRGV